MNIKNRLKKMEDGVQIGKSDSVFCKCGMPYISTFVICADEGTPGSKDIVNNVCPDCGRDVKPLTRAEFAKDAHNYEFEIIEPRANFTREDFEEHQNRHTLFTNSI